MTIHTEPLHHHRCTDALKQKDIGCLQNVRAQRRVKRWPALTFSLVTLSMFCGSQAPSSWHIPSKWAASPTPVPKVLLHSDGLSQINSLSSGQCESWKSSLSVYAEARSKFTLKFYDTSGRWHHISIKKLNWAEVFLCLLEDSTSLHFTETSIIFTHTLDT